MRLQFSAKEKTLIEKAKSRCLSTLKRNFSKGAFLAGPKRHSEFWARDALFSCLEIIDLKKESMIQSNVDFFLAYQKENGQIPLRSGFTLYNNLLFAKSCQAMAFLYQILKDQKRASVFQSQFNKTRNLIQEKFWNGDYFADYLTSNGKHYRYFSAFPNLLSIIFELANLAQARKIEEFIIKNKIDQPPVRQFFPSLPFPHNILNLVIFGLSYPYWNHWPHLGGLDVVAKIKTGFKKEAKAELITLAEHITRYGPIEVVNYQGKPVKNFFYQSEKNFSWTASAFLYALEKLRLELS